VIALNEAGYGLPPGSWSALRMLPEDALRRYAMACRAVVCAFDCEDDCGITLVSTRPEARGQGLCSTLMRQALRDARARGCATTTLEASPRGRPVYERLGYQALGDLEMWERRS
jgi:GNAT superfamily N-acetyltransferase